MTRPVDSSCLSPSSAVLAGPQRKFPRGGRWVVKERNGRLEPGTETQTDIPGRQTAREIAEHKQVSGTDEPRRVRPVPKISIVLVLGMAVSRWAKDVYSRKSFLQKKIC